MLDPWSLSQKRWKKRMALALGYRAALNRAAFLHVLNADEQRLIAPLQLTTRSVVLPNGVFIEELEPLPSRGAFRTRHPSLGAAPFVLFLSRLHPKKGLDVLAEAFAEVARRRSDVHLVVAGPDDGAQGDFQRRVTAAGIGSRVQVVGPLYGRDKLAALVDAACFCLPSRQEGFSVAITEALACGVPVVISEACHFPEVAAAGAGVVVALEPSRIAEALELTLAHPAQAARMGAAGSALVRANYTWDAIAAKTLSAYQAPLSPP
jgi:glycosyltransferase involved in cell wall biosynthesis